jgi:hypothetical protein
MRFLIRELEVSAKRAGPGDFISLPAGWEERSQFLRRYGSLDVFTFDPVSTALSKIERGAARDVDDASRLVREGIVALDQLRRAFDEILPRLETESLRIDEDDFRRKFEAFVRILGPSRKQ